MTDQSQSNVNVSPYSVGALLYTPAVDTHIAKRICDGTYSCLSSMVFCFEDAILHSSVAVAETTFMSSLRYIENAVTNGAIHTTTGKLPLLFARVRSPEHLEVLGERCKSYQHIFTGFVLPKYDINNAADYESVLRKLNTTLPPNTHPFYVMPTLESEAVIYKETRLETLVALKMAIDTIAPYVLNVRVGGNDFCRIFGLRRQVTQTIYDIGLIRDALTDILNIFCRDYIVSGPVWEYFETNSTDTLWREGLKRELALDRLNGFIGKTAIHPSQLPIIVHSMKVSRVDYEDAFAIMHWEENILGVSKSISSGRMNEVSTHKKWAEKIMLLAELYGIDDVI
jgi:citrate lyase beta subunit